MTASSPIDPAPLPTLLSRMASRLWSGGDIGQDERRALEQAAALLSWLAVNAVPLRALAAALAARHRQVTEEEKAAVDLALLERHPVIAALFETWPDATVVALTKMEA